jgi:hypothetical protein
MTDDAWGKSIRTYEIAQMEGRWKGDGSEGGEVKA